MPRSASSDSVVDQRPLDPKARADRALGVIFVRDRGTEECEHPVAQELADRALVAMDLLEHERERPLHERPGLLGVQALGETRVSGHVGEEHRDLLALAFQAGRVGADLRRERRRGVRLSVRQARVERRCRERRTAFHAEAAIGRVPVAAARTGGDDGGAA